MHAYGHLSFQFVRQHAENLILVEGLFVRPQVIEPLDDALFELLSDLSEFHIALDTVHFLLERRPLGVHVRDHAADVTDDRREDQHADEEVCDDEDVLDVPLRSRSLSDGRQRERGPVEGVYVHAQQCRVDRVHRLGDVEVHPVVGAEADPVAHLEVDARVPVDDDEDVHDEVHDPKRVRVVGTRLGAIEELEHPVDTDYAVKSEVRMVETGGEVDKICRDDAEHVEGEVHLGRVVLAQLRRVGHDEAVLQIR